MHCTRCLSVKDVYLDERAREEGKILLLMFFFIIIRWGKLLKKMGEGTGQQTKLKACTQKVRQAEVRMCRQMVSSSLDHMAGSTQ